MQLLLHFQDASHADKRFDRFLVELNQLAEKHGISVDDYQSMRLRQEEYRIEGCSSCGRLSVDRSQVSAEIENMLPDFWFYVQRATVVENELVCDLCGHIGEGRGK
jgi:hypothetical protein